MRPISIHALLAESDGGRQRCKTKRGISIHALLAESDRWHWPDRQSFSRFLSTLSLRRATEGRRARYCYGGYFYPRSPCGERLRTIMSQPAPWAFLSTLSLRRATHAIEHRHKPNRYFYPRSPCGERPHHPMRQNRTSVHFYPRSTSLAASSARAFLSTLSLRRATALHVVMGGAGIFLSTLSLRRATYSLQAHRFTISYFYPRSPCGERLRSVLRQTATTVYFYPRSPCGERLHLPCVRHLRGHFYPRSPCGERRPALVSVPGVNTFLSTLSLRRATLPRMYHGRLPRHFYPRSPCGERRAS